MARLICLSLLSAVFFFVSPVFAADPLPSEIPIPGQVTLVDLGSHNCIPCKMMAPILEKLEKEYQGQAAVIFIDVWEHKELAKRFKVSAIPTQVFFDANGKEVFRHQGFMTEEAMVAQFDKMGVVSPVKE